MQPAFKVKIGQTSGLDFPAVFQDQRPLDYIAQLAHVPRPMMGEQFLPSFRRKCPGWLVHCHSELSQEMVGQYNDVFAAFAQWWQPKLNNIQPVKKVFPELVFSYR